MEVVLPIAVVIVLSISCILLVVCKLVRKTTGNNNNEKNMILSISIIIQALRQSSHKTLANIVGEGYQTHRHLLCST